VLTRRAIPKDRTAGLSRRSRPIRVLLASPEEAERLGLATIVAAQADMELVAQTVTAENTAASIHSCKPDVAIVDAALLAPCVLRELEITGKMLVKPRLLALIMHLQDEGVQQALQARAQGILLRGMDYRDLLDAIRTVHAGNLYSSEMAAFRGESAAGEMDETKEFTPPDQCAGQDGKNSS
jgi:two-component system, NarL family, response regulator DegU